MDRKALHRTGYRVTSGNVRTGANAKNLDGHSADPACDGAGNLVVKVFWMELRHQGDEDGGLRRLVTRLPY